MSRVVVVGAGINGVTAAIELKKRGHRVILIDPGPLPHPLAASTDISKAVRAAYGADEDYTELAERSIKLWRKWNEEFGIELYHETGVMFVRRREMKPGDFEYESFKRLQQRGHNVERMNSAQLWRRFPAWNPELFRDGVLEFEAGYAESGRAVATLIQRAGSIGVELRSSSRFAHLDERDYRIEGIILDNGERIAADRIVIAERFPVFGADITTTGYYGFPLNRDGIVKIANHGPGREMSPESSQRVVTSKEEENLRKFLSWALPELAEAPIVYTRVCMYCDTHDGNFWIARDPKREGLVIAAGDCGHGFKFAPVLGEIIADAVEQKSNPILEKFRWRPAVPVGTGTDVARFRGEHESIM